MLNIWGSFDVVFGFWERIGLKQPIIIRTTPCCF